MAPRNEHSDLRYEATRQDVLMAVSPQPPNPRSGPDDPDPFGVNEAPLTEFLIAERIATARALGRPLGHVGRALKRNRLRELLAAMEADGSLVGLPRNEWAAMGRERPTRARDVLYALPSEVERWKREDQSARMKEEGSGRTTGDHE
ncbi:hypothetical protein [Streptomyces sp. NPDC058595]|uniref:hypothetical protein n=1 Tax=Streptomyces sp. NPDC058595 TaxID=3346550 RepID=UPI003654A9AA